MLIGVIILSLAGLASVAFAVFLGLRWKNFKKSPHKVLSTVLADYLVGYDMVDGGGEIRETIVEYELNGTKYESKLSGDRKRFKKGMQIVVRYKPDNPYYVDWVSSRFPFIWVFCTLGIGIGAFIGAVNLLMELIG